MYLAIAYPNEYSIGMSNLGFQTLIEQAHQLGAAVDRVFLPDPILLSELRRTSTPLFGLSSRKPLSDFDALLFSISFEPDYVGLVQLLELSGIEPLAERRPEGSPLIIAGGIAPTLNPEPIAPFCDLIGIGEAESLLPALIPILTEYSSREELLRQAAQLSGWYVPTFGPMPIKRQHAPLVKPCYPVFLSSNTAFAHHVDIEISRGCHWRCRFCAAGYVITPYRELPLEALNEAIDWGLQKRKKIGLVGTDVSDHSQLEAIVEKIWTANGEVAFPSFRVESLCRPSSTAAHLLRKKPPRTLTMAIESASEERRCALGKRLSPEQITKAVQLAADIGVPHIKIYLLVGIPGESWDELNMVNELARELVSIGFPGGITLSINGLVPKPGTPLQWEPAPDRHYLRQVQQFLRRTLPKNKIEVLFESPDWTRWQALLSLGGREVSRYLCEATQTNWRSALAHASHEMAILRGHGRWPDGELPWRFINHGTSTDTLAKHRIQ